MTTHLLLVISFLLLAGEAAGVTTTLSTSPSPPSPPPPPPLKAARSPPRSPHSAAAPPANCSGELVSFSKCLQYTSSSSNKATDSPSRQCCNVVASAFASGNAVCFCYLIQKPNILGFPLNSTRILSLTSLCPMKVHGTKANFSLTTLCSRRHTLPPMKSITSPKHSTPRNSGPVNPPPPPTVNFTEDSQESTAYSGSPAPADSNISVPAHSDTPAPLNGLHSVPRLPLVSSWRPFSTNGINRKSGSLLPFIMDVVYVVVYNLT